MGYTLRAIQQHVGGDISGNAEETITGLNVLELAQQGDLAFAERDTYHPQVQQTHASAIIVTKNFPEVAGKNLLRVDRPRIAFTKAMYLFQHPRPASTGVHPSAVVSPDAVVESGVTIGECAVIRPGAKIGRGTILESGVHIGANVVIGQDCFIGPNVVIMHGSRIGDRVIMHGGTVIGGDGFGYVWAEDRHLKIPQLGHVIIEDDVELGSNVCVDRAMLGATIIRRGTKIDNLVQIAHSDVIGQHVIMAGQVGLAGSVTVGDGAMFGGQSGAVDHVTIGAGAKIGAASPVTKDVRPGEMVWGFPARPLERAKREMAGLSLVPRLLQKVRTLTETLAGLRRRLDAIESPSARPAPSDRAR